MGGRAAASQRLGERLLLAALLVATTALVLVPVGSLVRQVLRAGGAPVGRVVRAPGFATAVAHSLELAVIVPLLAVPLGVGAALLLRHPGTPARGLLRFLTVLPLIVPQFVLGYSWSQAYGPAGFTHQLGGLSWPGLTGPAGVVVVSVVDAAPLAYLFAVVGLATRSQPGLEHAARVNGANQLAVLRTVTLPLLRPAIAGGLVITFVATLEGFAVPQVLGTPAGFQTVPTRLYADLALGSAPDSFLDAVTLALGLALVAVLVLVPADLVLTPRLRSTRAAVAAGPSPAGQRSLLGSAMAAGLGLYAAATVLLPGLALLAASMTRAVGLAPTPANWTLNNFRSALDAPTRAAFAHSLELAAVSATILTVLGVVVAVLGARRSARLVGTATMLTFALPGSALAVGLLISYDRLLDGTLTLILLAYLAKFWAISHRTVAGAIDRFPHDEWRAARVSGARPVAAARTVWLPAMAPALAGAWLLVFVSALHELTMSSLLYSTGSQTLAVAVLNSQEVGGTGPTAALAVTLTVIVLALTVPAWLALRWRARGRSPRPTPPMVTRAAVRVR